MESLRHQPSAAVSTSSIDIKSILVSVCEEQAVANDMIGELRAELKTGHDKMDHNRQ